MSRMRPVWLVINKRTSIYEAGVHLWPHDCYFTLTVSQKFFSVQISANPVLQNSLAFSQVNVSSAISGLHWDQGKGNGTNPCHDSF